MNQPVDGLEQGAERNPYAPSAGVLSAASPVQPDTELEPASQSRRFVNLVIDSAAFVVLLFVIGIVSALLSMSVGVDLIQGAGPLLGPGVMFFYYFLCEALLGGRTVGKLITRTQVVAQTGEKPEVWQIALRTLYRFMPFDGFSFLFGEKVGWHDRWSKTRVVMIRKQH